jgi:predicted TIM-barrel fold metal-dependent hydrolase
MDGRRHGTTATLAVAAPRRGPRRPTTSSAAALFLVVLTGEGLPAVSEPTVSQPLVSQPIVSQASAPRAPAVDHHQHLLSPALAKLWSDRLLPVAAVPAEVTALLDGLERSWNSEPGLAPLYAEDSILIEPSSEAFVRGREAISARLSRLFQGAFELVPNAFHVEGDNGYVTLYLTRARDGVELPIAETLLTIRRGAAGDWQVVTQTLKVPGPTIPQPFEAKDLVRLMDQAGIRRAVVLSAAYAFSDKDLPPSPDEVANVRAENDWTAQQVAQFPDRLIGFCAVSPIRDYALGETRRCANELRLRGLKMHFGNSGVDVARPEHLASVQAVFRVANELRLPVVVHIYREGEPGVEQAKILLEEILPAAPDIVVQIAHMAGSGPGWDEDALAVFADALRKGDPRTAHLYFDVATNAEGQSHDRLVRLARLVREIGVGRILYGSDSVFGRRPTPRQQWGSFQGLVPLAEAEIAAIASNVAPYAR